MSRTFASLAFPNYRKWFFGALVANTGTWMQRIAQTWIVLTDLSDDSGLAVGWVIAFQTFPALLLTPLGGVMADRWNRRRLLFVTQGGMGLSSLGLGILVLAGVAELWHVYLFAVLLGIMAALDGPVRQAFVSELVPTASLPNAVGLNGTSFNGARLLGPAIAGFLIALVGAGWVFVLTGVAFGAPMIAMILMRTGDFYPQRAPKRGKRGIGVAVRYVRAHSDIAMILAIMTVTSAFGLNFQLFISTMVREAFGRGPEDFGVLNALMGVGALGGALMAARRTRPRTRLVIFAAIGYGITLTASAFVPNYLAYAVLAVPIGYLATTMLNSANSTIQLASAPEVRGRVMALYLMVVIGITPIGSPIMGWITEEFGARASVAFGGVTSMIAGLAGALWAWRRWGVEVRYHLRPRPSLEFLNPLDELAEFEQDEYHPDVADDSEQPKNTNDSLPPGEEPGGDDSSDTADD